MPLKIDGATVKSLKAGELSFTAYEMGQGPLVLCLHGFPDTPYTFRHLLPELAKAGFRAVAVTMRGYEPSSQPRDNDYGAAALTDDVVAWMDALGERQAHLIGHDWGASIVYAVAALAPDRVRTLTTLAVPHPAGFATVGLKDWGQLRRSWYMFFFQWRGVSDRRIERNDWRFLENRWRDWSPGWHASSGDMNALKAIFREPGVKGAALGYYRAAFDQKAPRYAEGAALFAKPIAAPTLGLCGARDGCISADVFERSMLPAMFTGPVTVKRIADAGHFLQLERPGEVNREILSFLAQHRD